MPPENRASEPHSSGMTDRYKTYLEYLQSEHWSSLRLKCYKAAEFQCEACNDSRKLVGHHLIYRVPLTSCTTDDIMCLCETCHNALHRWLSVNNKKESDYSRLQTRSVILRLRSGGNPPAEFTKPIPLVDNRPPQPARGGDSLYDRAQRTLCPRDFEIFTKACGGKRGMGKGKWNHAVKLLQRKTGKRFMHLKDCLKGKRARQLMAA
jgi:hypothetical protein